MTDSTKDPIDPLAETRPANEGSPRFGLLLIALVLAVLLIAVITIGSEAYYS